MSVVVATRVRPFNARELALQSRLCVRMDGSSTVLVNEAGEERAFAFDYSFWSHDGFREEPDGRHVSADGRYADQGLVYERVGRQILANALAGYHCCLFAYGQTGAGKSYSMVGFGANLGIVPTICHEIFQQLAAPASAQRSYEINFSMLEIYNEKVQDLLVPIARRTPAGLKVHQSKSLGIYVDGLSKHAVDSFAALEERMSEGNRNRTIAATQMNASSTRAHTIFTIELKQKEVVGGRRVERLSVINLVDLAGSEKLSKSGASGDRLKEGCSINKSLTVLGLVISTLAEKSLGRQKKAVVPYRDSCLTRILQNALGGNSKTLMICAISPAGGNYEESLSTLRYADQAKKIQCHATVNENEGDKKVRELKSENDELKKLIAQLRSGTIKTLPFHIAEELGEGGQFPSDETVSEKIRTLEEMLSGKNQMMREMEKSFDLKLREEKERKTAAEERNYAVAHLTNLNEDPLLSNKIYHNLVVVREFYIGRRDSEPPPHIVLQSTGIQPRHASIENRPDGFFLCPGCPEAAEFTFVNGDSVAEPTRLHNFDRILFGIGSLFVFRDPQSAAPPRGDLAAGEIDWEHCQLEIASKHKHLTLMVDPAEEKKRKERLAEIQGEYERMKERHEDEKTRIKEEHQRKLDEIVQQMCAMPSERDELIQNEIQNFELLRDEFDRSFATKLEVEKTKKEEIARDFIKTFQEKDAKKIEQKIVKIFPNIIETNLIASELKRDVQFSIHISYFYIDIENIHQYEKQKKYRIKIRVDNNELGYAYFWDLRKFTSRYFMIKELAEQMGETGEPPELDLEADPFWDPPEYRKVGEGFLKLMSLAYLTDNPNELALVGDAGKAGTLAVDVLPTSAAGEPLEPDDAIFDDFVDNPNDLIGQDLHFSVQIGHATLPENLCTDAYAQYTLKVPNEENALVDVTFKTAVCSGKEREPDFGYARLHCYKAVSDELVKYLLKNNAVFEVFAFPDREMIAQKHAQLTRTNSLPKADDRRSVATPGGQLYRGSIFSTRGEGGKSLQRVTSETIQAADVSPRPEEERRSAGRNAEAAQEAAKKKGCIIF